MVRVLRGKSTSSSDIVSNACNSVKLENVNIHAWFFCQTLTSLDLSLNQFINYWQSTVNYFDYRWKSPSYWCVLFRWIGGWNKNCGLTGKHIWTGNQIHFPFIYKVCLMIRWLNEYEYIWDSNVLLNSRITTKKKKDLITTHQAILQNSLFRTFLLKWN